MKGQRQRLLIRLAWRCLLRCVPSDDLRLLMALTYLGEVLTWPDGYPGDINDESRKANA